MEDFGFDMIKYNTDIFACAQVECWAPYVLHSFCSLPWNYNEQRDLQVSNRHEARGS